MPDNLETIATAVKPLTEGTARFLGLLLKPGAEQVGTWIGDRFKIARQQNTEKVIAKAKAKLDAAEINPTSVPTKILVPILERCGMEDEDEMIERWANLLASAASGKSIPPAYIQTLSVTSPGEARLLDALTKAQKIIPKFDNLSVGVKEFRLSCPLSPETFTKTVVTLFHLGLVHMVFPTGTIGGFPHHPPIHDGSRIGTTPFADDFLAACT